MRQRCAKMGFEEPVSATRSTGEDMHMMHDFCFLGRIGTEYVH